MGVRMPKLWVMRVIFVVFCDTRKALGVAREDNGFHELGELSGGRRSGWVVTSGHSRQANSNRQGEGSNSYSFQVGPRVEVFPSV